MSGSSFSSGRQQICRLVSWSGLLRQKAGQYYAVLGEMKPWVNSIPFYSQLYICCCVIFLCLKDGYNQRTQNSFLWEKGFSLKFPNTNSFLFCFINRPASVLLVEISFGHESMYPCFSEIRSFLLLLLWSWGFRKQSWSCKHFLGLAAYSELPTS